MRPIKAHELSHRGAMAQLMQRPAGVCHAQDSRSPLVQRLPGLFAVGTGPVCGQVGLDRSADDASITDQLIWRRRLKDILDPLPPDKQKDEP